MNLPSYDELVALSDDDFNALQAIMSAAQETRRARFRLGEKVTFIALGVKHTGTVVKLDYPDTVDVWTGLCTWRLAPSQLQKA